MNTILLQPTDVLFFRDGRPMTGSLAGHGAAWPLPNVTDAAFHAALHRSGLDGHRHDQRRHGERAEEPNRRFGSLVSAGPFPVRHTAGVSAGTWYFARPLDLMNNTLTPALLPTDRFDPGKSTSSLPAPLKYAVGNSLPPSKDSSAKAWLSTAAYQRYLGGNDATLAEDDAYDDAEFCDSEATIGIGIDPDTQAQDKTNLYSASYLRLRDGWRLGVFARTDEKNESQDARVDLIRDLITEQKQLLVGGQQRTCTAELRSGGALPLPRGKQSGFSTHKDKSLMKWVLLSPAIWPAIPAQSKDGRAMMPHAGGWLPNWVRETDGQVMLKSGERQRRSYGGKHSRGFENAAPIGARLVAAIVPKPLVVTGWALANETDRPEGGAKSTHLAVPAGAVYYFEADSEEHAKRLADALNWHGGEDNPVAIKNRRSTLLGEKGFGLGVCGTWNFYDKR